MEPDEAKLGLEALLFVSNEPLTRPRLRELLEVDDQALERALVELQADLQGRSLQVVEVAGGYRMVTRPRFHRYVERYFKPQPERISRAALEALAIIACRQPVTRPEIDAIRGVNSAGCIESLLRKGLIREVGRKDVPGRPILYATTQAFLELAGLRDLSQLRATGSDVPSSLRGISGELQDERELLLEDRPVEDDAEPVEEAADAE